MSARPHLLGLDLSQRLDGVEAGVLGERDGDGLEGVGEGAECVLLDCFDLVGLAADSQGAGDLGGTATVDHAGVADQVPDGAQCVMHAPLGLLYDLKRQISSYFTSYIERVRRIRHLVRQKFLDYTLIL